MSCEFGHEDCRFEGTDRCGLCIASCNYAKAKQRTYTGLKKHANKADGRGGSHFEYKNYEKNSKILKDTVCNMTLNSGATILEKGDAWIRGNVNIMEEYKTRTKVQAPGKKTFTIHKEWLDKLIKDFKNANRQGKDFEFFDLRFSFQEGDQDVYCILEENELLQWIKTLDVDRRKAQECDLKINLANKKADLQKAELSKAYAEIAELKAEIALLKHQKEMM